MKTQVLMTACKSYLDLASVSMSAWKKIGMEPTLYHMISADEEPYPGSVPVPLDKNKLHRQQCWMYLLYATSLLEDDQLCMIADADLIPNTHSFFHDLERFAVNHSGRLVCTEYGTGVKDLGRIRAHHVIGYARVWKKLIGRMSFRELFREAKEIGEQHNKFAIDEMWLTKKLVNRHWSFPLRIWCDKNNTVPCMSPSAKNWPFKFDVATIHMPRSGDAFYQTGMYNEVVEYVG